jgi:hypothetical protein
VVIVTDAKSPSARSDIIQWSGRKAGHDGGIVTGAIDLALTAFGKAAGVNIITVPFSGGPRPRRPLREVTS